MDFNIRFGGGDADKHRIPAHEGAVALEGLARSIILISHFVSEGEVRKRAPFTENAKLYLTHTRPGSFETIYNLVVDNPVAAGVIGATGTIAIGVITNLVYDLTKHAYTKLTGQEESLVTTEGKTLSETRGGDVDALVDAVEPALIRAHEIINNGVININVSNGPRNIATLNAATKRYIKTTITEDVPKSKQVSVGSFNVNSKYGRVYDSELGKTVPFIIHRDGARRTSTNVARSLQRYASRADDSHVNIKYLVSLDLDGRVKRYIILDAWFDN